MSKLNQITFSLCLLKCPECGYTSQLNIRNDILPEYLKGGMFRICEKCLKGRIHKVKIFVPKEKVEFT